jgi:hypothetical protein
MKINKLITTKCILMLFPLLLVSCYDNSIYFDMNSQSICSCNKHIISNLLINGLNNKDFYHFSKKSETKGTNAFCVIKLNNDYILDGILAKNLPLDSFKLKPNTEYEIENHTYGDAASDKLLIKTNNIGNVIYTNKTSCK